MKVFICWDAQMMLVVIIHYSISITRTIPSKYLLMPIQVFM